MSFHTSYLKPSQAGGVQRMMGMHKPVVNVSHCALFYFKAEKQSFFFFFSKPKGKFFEITSRPQVSVTNLNTPWHPETSLRKLCRGAFI